MEKYERGIEISALKPVIPKPPPSVKINFLPPQLLHETLKPSILLP